jgi:hypothetical protein
VDHVVGEILVEVRQRVRVTREPLVLLPQAVPCRQLAEPLKVNDVEGGDVVGSPVEVLLPVPAVPEPKAVHLLPVAAKRRVAVRRALKVDLKKFVEVGAHHLVRGVSESKRVLVSGCGLA